MAPKLVGGVTPGRGEQQHLGLPVFDTVKDAVRATGATASMIYVPTAGAAEFDSGAVDAGIELAVVHHRRRAGERHGAREGGARGFGYAPRRPQLPGRHHTPGGMQDRHHAGLLFGASKNSVRYQASRSGTLTYEAVFQTTNIGLGQSTCVGIGGDPVRGMNFIDVLELFQRDPRTRRASFS